VVAHSASYFTGSAESQATRSHRAAKYSAHQNWPEQTGRKRSGTPAPAIPHRGSDFDAFLSIKPRISLAEEFEEVLVLIGQIEDHEPLSWDIPTTPFILDFLVTAL
jgi:hypothetical protein